MFAHLDSINVKSGQLLKAGDAVGGVGTTGMSTGDHLHLEIRYDNGTSWGGNCWGNPRGYFEEMEDKEMEKTPVVMDGINYEAYVIGGRTFVIMRPFRRRFRC